MNGYTYRVYGCIVLTDAAPDFLEDPDEDLAVVIGDKAGLDMEFESDEKVDIDINYEEWFLWRNSKTLVIIQSIF